MDLNFDFTKISDAAILYLPKVVLALFTLIIGFWIIARVVGFLRSSLQKRKIDPSVTPFLGSLVSVGLKIMLLLSVASMFGIETTSFIAIFSALAFAIGLALQGTLGHFASGVLLLVFRPYKVDDLVEIGGGKIGTVLEIQVFNTILATLDNRRVIVPNGEVTSNVITNITGQGTIGIERTFGIGYSDDIDKAREVILRVIDECPYILDNSEHSVVVAELADSSVNLVTRPFAKSEHFWEATFYLNEHVKKEFDKAGIGIPFPQMDVHLHKQA